jgi:hypothetical protein
MVPPGEADRLRAMGIEIVHEFHFQPLILVAASGDQLRALARSDPTVVIDVSRPVRAILEECEAKLRRPRRRATRGDVGGW